MADRPVSLPSITRRIPTDHGSMFVTVVFQGGKPVEVFAPIGKSGSCEKAFMQALARSIGLGLHYGVPLDAYEETLRGIHCTAVGDGAGFVHSPADGLAKVFRELSYQEGEVEEAPTVPVQVASPPSPGPRCPDCGMDVLIFEEGCNHCRSCGYSKCG